MLWLLAATALAQEVPIPPAGPDTEEAAPLLKEPELIEFIQAPYPPEAEAQGLEGAVLLLVEIDEAGVVTDVQVLEPAGHGFDEAAVAAVRQFRFHPAEDEQGPLPVALEFAYNFALAPLEVEEQAPAEAPINLEGTLVEMSTQLMVDGAAITVKDLDGTVLGETLTDGEGAFSLRGIPLGKVKIEAVRPGYQDADATVEITPGELTRVQLWARNKEYREGDVVVVYQRDRPPEITRRTLSMSEVRSVPGTFGDPVRVIQDLPGAARSPFSTGLLILRGANPEDSNVYIDGVEVPLVYHLGGFRSILNPDLIEAVDYLPGTYGASYGRSTGGVIDVRTQREYPDRLRTTFKADFLDAGVYATGRVGKVGFAAGFRRSYIDAILAVALANAEFYAAPRWTDYQLKLEALDTGQDDLSLLFFGFDDQLFIRQSKDAPDQLGVGYSTQRIVPRWRHEFSDKLALTLQPAFGLDGITFGFGSTVRFELRSTIFDLRGDLAWTPSRAFSLRGGVDSEVERDGVEIFVSTVPVDGDDPNSETEPLFVDEGLWVVTPDPFVEATWRPLADPDHLALVGGLRVPLLIKTDQPAEISLDPRLGMRWEVVKGGTFKTGAGIYHQPPDGPELAYALGFERAWSGELGWEQKLGTAIQADITGYFRWMDQLYVGGEGDRPTGVGRAWGMEIMLRHARVKRFFGWISYTLSKSERNDSPGDPEGWYPFDFDQTHILTGIAGYRLPLDFEFSAKAQTTTGNPYTPYAGGIELMDEGTWVGIPSAATNSVRQPAYWAVDIRVDKLFTYKRWQLELYVDVLNVLHGENPEFALYNYDYTEQAWITGLPTIPSLGAQVEVNW